MLDVSCTIEFHPSAPVACTWIPFTYSVYVVVWYGVGLQLKVAIHCWSEQLRGRMGEVIVKLALTPVVRVPEVAVRV